MANTLTGLIPTMYSALDVVSRELVGFIPNVSRDAQVAQAAVDQVIRSPVVPAMTSANIVAAATSASGTDRVMSYVDMSLTKAKKVSFNLTGEEELSLGMNNQSIAMNSFAQAFRTLCNEIETDIGALYKSSSRAYGTAGTAPFATVADMSDIANINKILDDNGAPKIGRKLIINSSAAVNLRAKHSELFKVNEAGTSDMLREGRIGRLMGYDIGESAGVALHVIGTANASYDTNLLAGYVVGDTSIAVDTGSGTIVAGDVVTFAGDTNKYVVGTALSGGSLVLNKPGLRATLADGVDVTLGAAYRANLAFTPDAMMLATRTPAIPTGGDGADDRTYVTDPVSGLSFEVAVYRQYRQVSFEVGIVWGVKAIKSEHMATLFG